MSRRISIPSQPVRQADIDRQFFTRLELRHDIPTPPLGFARHSAPMQLEDCISFLFDIHFFDSRYPKRAHSSPFQLKISLGSRRIGGAQGTGYRLGLDLKYTRISRYSATLCNWNRSILSGLIVAVLPTCNMHMLESLCELRGWKTRRRLSESRLTLTSSNFKSARQLD